MSTIICQFGTPIYWDNTDNLFRALTGNPVHFVQGQNWNYSSATCSGDDMTASSTAYFLIQNPATPTQNFIIQKSFTYGDIAQIFFFLIFLFAFILFLIKDFFGIRDVEIQSLHKKNF